MPRMKRFMTTTLYLYLDPANATFVRQKGAGDWGSYSNYINFLIASARKDKAAIGRTKEYAKAAFAPIQVRTATKTGATKKPKKGGKKAARTKTRKASKKKPTLKLVKAKARIAQTAAKAA